MHPEARFKGDSLDFRRKARVSQRAGVIDSRLLTIRLRSEEDEYRFIYTTKKPTQKGRFLAFYMVALSCRKAPPEFRSAPSTLRNFVPSGAAHEAAAGHALAEPSDNYTASIKAGFSRTITILWACLFFNLAL